jgi:hypothetical protein
MRKLLMFLLFAFWSVPAFAQCPVWSRTYGGSSYDDGWYGQQTTDGGYIVTGETQSFGSGGGDVYLIKSDSLGDTLWTRTYGGIYSDYGFSVQQTTDGGYVVVGRTLSFGTGNVDVYLIKTDSTGDTLWTRTYGGSGYDEGIFVQQITDGGYIVAGYTSSFGAGGYDAYLIKTDSFGDTLWTCSYGGSNDDYGSSVQQTTDGGYIVVGLTGSFGVGHDDVYLIKTDSIGDTLWTRTYGGSSYDQGYSVQQTTDGGYIVAGRTLSFGASDGDIYLIKTDSIGDTLWTRTYGGSNEERGYWAQQTTDGGYIVSGLTSSFGAGSYDAYLIKTDSLGDTLWIRTYGGYWDDRGFWAQQTTDGGYIVSGMTQSFGAGNFDVMLTKLDSLGNACIGEFVSSTVQFAPSTVTSPATVVTSPPTIVTSPPTTVTSPAIEVTTVCIVQRGDANRDGVVDIEDVVYLINYLFLGGPAPDPLELGDASCSGVVDVTDVVYLINYLFVGGPPPCC